MTCTCLIPNASGAPGEPSLEELVRQCQQVDRNAARHVCFDALPLIPDPPPESTQTPGAENSSSVAGPSNATSRTQPDTGEPAMAEVEETSEFPMTTTIRAVERTRDGRLMFLLENDTRWIEDKASQLKVSAGSRVEIVERGAFGGRFWKNYGMRIGSYTLKVVPLD